MCDCCDDVMDCNCECDCDMCDGMTDTAKGICTVGSILCFILSLLIVILFPLSVTILEPVFKIHIFKNQLYYGLEYDANSLQIDQTKLWTSGRYWIGLGHSFIEFPRHQEVILFSNQIPHEKLNYSGGGYGETSYLYPSIKARTKFFIQTYLFLKREGMIIYLSVMVGYTLTTNGTDIEKIKQLMEIYQRFDMNWQTFIRLQQFFLIQLYKRIVQSEVRNQIAQYQTENLKVYRAQIEQDMFKVLEIYLDEFHFVCRTFYIMNLQLPAEYETAVTQTEIVKQLIFELDINFVYYKETNFNEILNKQKLILKQRYPKLNMIFEFLKYPQIVLNDCQATNDAEVLYKSKQGQALAITKKLSIYKDAIATIQDSGLFTGTISEVNDSILDLMYIYVLQNSETKQNTIHPISLPSSLLP